jgi:hypothetical protein
MFGNAGGGWHSFGNFSQSRGPEIFRSTGSNLTSGGRWSSFGSPRSASWARNRSGFSSFGPSRTSSFGLRSTSASFSDRFSNGGARSPRFSSFSSYSSGPAFGNFGGARLGVTGFGGSAFANSSFGSAGLFGSGIGPGIGSGLSLLPNLLGSFLGVGRSFFGGPGMLAANALSLAVRLFVSGIGAAQSNQGGFDSGDAGEPRDAFGLNYGVGAVPVAPACALAGPQWAPGFYCGPSVYAFQPYGSNSFGYLRQPGVGFTYR